MCTRSKSKVFYKDGRTNNVFLKGVSSGSLPTHQEAVKLGQDEGGKFHCARSSHNEKQCPRQYLRNRDATRAPLTEAPIENIDFSKPSGFSECETMEAWIIANKPETISS